jgi:hypothetical protein
LSGGAFRYAAFRARPAFFCAGRDFLAVPAFLAGAAFLTNPTFFFAGAVFLATPAFLAADAFFFTGLVAILALAIGASLTKLVS